MDKNHYIIMANKEKSKLRIEYLKAEWGGFQNITIEMPEVNLTWNDGVEFSSGKWDNAIPYRVKFMEIIAGKFNNPDSILLDLKNAGWMVTHSN